MAKVLHGEEQEVRADFFPWEWFATAEKLDTSNSEYRYEGFPLGLGAAAVASRGRE